MSAIGTRKKTASQTHRAGDEHYRPELLGDDSGRGQPAVEPGVAVCGRLRRTRTFYRRRNTASWQRTDPCPHGHSRDAVAAVKAFSASQRWVSFEVGAAEEL